MVRSLVRSLVFCLLERCILVGSVVDFLVLGSLVVWSLVVDCLVLALQLVGFVVDFLVLGSLVVWSLVVRSLVVRSLVV